MKTRYYFFAKILAITTLTFSFFVADKLLADKMTIKQEIIWFVQFLIILQIVSLLIYGLSNFGRFLSNYRLKNSSEDEAHPRAYRIEQYLLQQWQPTDDGDSQIFLPIMNEQPYLEHDEKTRKIIRAIQKWDDRNRYFNTMTLDEFLGREFGLVGGKPSLPRSTFYSWRTKYHQSIQKGDHNQDSSES